VSEFQTCVGCGKTSPETETEYTLISAQFGWRLTRSTAADGSLILQWRCPTCWAEFKRSQAEASVAASKHSSKPPPASTRRPLASPGTPPSGASVPRPPASSVGRGRLPK
jgi:hypothetical protein